MTREEAFQEYEELLAKITEQAHTATEEAKALLHGRLKALRNDAHTELKAIRTITQKTR